MPEKIETIADAAAWIHEHDGRINAWWESQHKFNAEIEERFRKLENRVSAIEKRIFWMCGAASMLGAIIGAYLK